MTETERRGTLGFAVAATFHFFFLLFLNAHELWRPWFGGLVTERFSEVLWAVNLGLVVQIFGNALLSVSSTRLLRRIMEVVFSLGALVGALAFYRVFPLDLTRFGDSAVVLARVVFFLGVVAASMVVLVNVFILLRTPELRRAGRGAEDGAPLPPDDSHSGA
jgi:hypothetical protein